MLCRISGIDRNILLHRRPLHSICVAQKMSWASSRYTTRIEDAAYSLLGLFGVNMPLLYGEEDRAFLRLQEEIIKSSPDLSILAWTDSTNQGIREHSSELHCGVLAKSPAQFSTAGSISGSMGIDSVSESSVTNRGIRLFNALCIVKDSIIMRSSYIMPLYCKSASGAELGIRLEKIGDEMFLRNDPCNIVEYQISRYIVGPRYIHLATTIPYALRINDGPDQYVASQYLASLRTQVLALEFPEFVSVFDYWGVFNHCNGTFFETSGRPRAWVALRFSVYFDPSIVGTHGIGAQMTGTTTINCMLYIIGWTSVAENSMRHFLVNVTECADAVAEVQNILTLREYDVSQAQDVLDHYLPDSSSLTLNIPGSDLKFHIYIKYTRMADTRIYRQPFWKLKIQFL